MEYTKQSITIPNMEEYTFRLRLDDIHGIIRLSKQESAAKTIRITDRSIPITTDVKWQFHHQRSGYSEGERGFVGSYIDRESSSDSYDRWKKYIISQYREFRDKEKNKCQHSQ